MVDIKKEEKITISVSDGVTCPIDVPLTVAEATDLYNKLQRILNIYCYYPEYAWPIIWPKDTQTITTTGDTQVINVRITTTKSVPVQD